MTQDSSPVVSIGMPTYNSAATLCASVESLLAQTFTDFELVISDNASTDGTWGLIEAFAARDPRVRAFRQPQNIGANGNYSAVFRASRGRYFKWASSNDWCSADLLKRCVELLDADSRIVLVASRARLFETSIDEFTDYAGDIACMQDNPVDRFIHVGTHLALNNAMNGLVRRETLSRTRLIEHYPGADVVLVGHLALLGKIALLDAPLFYRRMDSATATRMMSEAAVHHHHYPVRTWRSILPSWRLAWGWARVTFSSGLRASETRRALGWALRQTYWRRDQLGRDLLDLLHRPRGS